jgi:hypothetical protein
MRLPVYVSISTEKDEEEIEGKICGDEGDLTDIAEIEEMCDLPISRYVRRRI